MMDPVSIDAYVIDSLMADLVGHDRQPSAFLVYLYLWRRGGAELAPVVVSLNALAEGTGLSKRSVQDALGRLQRRRLVSIKRASITAVPEYRVLAPWRRRNGETP